VCAGQCHPDGIEELSGWHNLAKRGGQYAPSRTGDRLSEAEQARVDHAREVAEAKSQPCNPF
jgi:hypothetical protein